MPVIVVIFHTNLPLERNFSVCGAIQLEAEENVRCKRQCQAII